LLSPNNKSGKHAMMETLSISTQTLGVLDGEFGLHEEKD